MVVVDVTVVYLLTVDVVGKTVVVVVVVVVGWEVLVGMRKREGSYLRLVW